MLNFHETLSEGICKAAIQQGQEKLYFQEAMAKELGYSLHTIYAWRRPKGKGGYIPKYEQLERLANYLVSTGNLDRDWLIRFLTEGGHPAKERVICEIFPDAVLPSYVNMQQPPRPSFDKLQPRNLKRLASVAVVGGLVVFTVAVFIFIFKPPQPSCQNKLNLLDCVRWNEVSAEWKPNGLGVVIKENSTDYFGKVESELIDINVNEYPILHIRVTKIDPETGLTIQIREPKPGPSIEKDVLKLNAIGDYKINIAQEMGWQGTHSFTLNAWVSGEGKSATFDVIALDAK